MKKILLIDGNSLINRSFYAIRLLSNKNGVYTNAVTGFFSTLLRLIEELGINTKAEESDCAAVAFDLRAPTLRHKMYDGYKKNRKGMPDELAAQLPYIKDILDYMGITRVEAEGYEADDIIGTLSKSTAKAAENSECFIATGDRDAFQLIGDNISVCLASNKEEIIYTPQIIEEKYGIKPAQFIEVKALMGDSSDSIPGVAGIGEKTALSLIQKYNSIDYIYENIDKLNISDGVKNKLLKDKEMCFLSRELGRIITDAPIDLISSNPDKYAIGGGEPEKLARLLNELELKTVIKRLESFSKPKNSEISKNIENAETENIENTKIPIDDELNEVLRDMELAGIKIDTDGLRRFGEELEPQIAELQSRIYSLTGEEFNISSPKQLGEILFDKLKLPTSKKTKTGYSTGAEVLESLIDAHPVMPLIIEYRELTKLNSTYVQGLLKCVGEDGRIHTTFKNETRTGRLSSVEPNIQNIPVRTERGRVLRRFFIAEQGCLLIDADYSQIELRVLANFSGDPIMLDAFKNNADIHSITAAQVFCGGNTENVTREMRTAAKAVNFGIVYGMGAFSLSKEIGVSVSQAKLYIEQYLSKYKKVAEFLEKTVRDATESGYVKTALGRIRYVPELKSSNHNIRAMGERIAKNTPIQGTAADIIKLAMVKVYKRLKTEDFGGRLLLQVHDELIAEVPKNLAEKTAAILREEMTAAGKELDMDLSVDVKAGKSWYETH